MTSMYSHTVIHVWIYNQRFPDMVVQDDQFMKTSKFTPFLVLVTSDIYIYLLAQILKKM